MKPCLSGLLVLCVVLFSFPVVAQDTKFDVVYINSYSEASVWGARIFTSFRRTLASEPLNIHAFNLNSKKEKLPEQIKLNAQKALRFIEKIQPDVIVASDDNASKYLLMPYFKNAAVPVIYVGVDVDDFQYGYPYSNSTGLVETGGIAHIIKRFKEAAKDRKIGAVFADTTTGKKKLDLYKLKYGKQMDFRVAGDMAQWKAIMKEFDQAYEVIILDDLYGLNGFNSMESLTFVSENIKTFISSISLSNELFSHVTVSDLPEEHGVWAAKAVKKLKSGIPISQIPKDNSVHIEVIINKNLEKVTGVKIPQFYYKYSSRVIEY